MIGAVMMANELKRWRDQASVEERCEAGLLLADALFGTARSPSETKTGEAALDLLARDPSPKVRAALSQRLARERTAPARILRLLARDIDAVALPVVKECRLLAEDDLIDLALTGSVRVRCALARRRELPDAVVGALATGCERIVLIDLLSNHSIEMDAQTLRSIAHRDEADGTLHDLLLQRPDLPGDVRDMLLVRTAELVSAMDLARGLLGEAQMARIAREACEQGRAIIGQSLDAPQMEGFVQHLRRSGGLTTAFLVRAASGGHVDLFAYALSNLSGLRFERVRAILVEARDPSFSALCAAARVPFEVSGILLRAVRLWRGIARTRSHATDEVLVDVLERLVAEQRRADGANELTVLLTRLCVESSGRSTPGRAGGGLDIAA